MLGHILSFVVLVHRTSSAEDDKYVVIKIPDIQSGTDGQKSLVQTDEGEKSLNQVQEGNDVSFKGDVDELERTPNETSGDDYSVLPFHLREISPEISGYVGAESQLKCQSHEPFTSCQFISPRGDNMTVEKSSGKEGERIECLCNKIEYDETRVCAIIIKELKKEDEGEWLCQMEFSSIDGWKGYRGSRTRILPKELREKETLEIGEQGLPDVTCPVLTVTNAHHKSNGYYSVTNEKVPWAEDRPVYVHVDKSELDDKIIFFNLGNGWCIGWRKRGLEGGQYLYSSGGLNTTEPWQGEWKDEVLKGGVWVKWKGEVEGATVKCLDSVLCPILTVSNTKSAETDGDYSITKENMFWAPDKRVYVHTGKEGEKDRLIYWRDREGKSETGSIDEGRIIGYRLERIGNTSNWITNTLYSSGGLHAKEPWQGEWEGNVKVKCKGMTDVGVNNSM